MRASGSGTLNVFRLLNMLLLHGTKEDFCQTILREGLTRQSSAAFIVPSTMTRFSWPDYFFTVSIAIYHAISKQVWTTSTTIDSKISVLLLSTCGNLPGLSNFDRYLSKRSSRIQSFLYFRVKESGPLALNRNE